MKRLYLFLAVLAILALPVAAQTAAVEIDPNTVSSIVAGGLLGLGVIGVTQIVKNALKVEGVVAIFISLLVSAVATVVFLISGGGGFSVLKFIGYTVSVFVVANGWYKFKIA